MNGKTELIVEYLKKIKSANKEFTKKEAFKDLLNRLYFEDKNIVKIIDKVSLGAETTVVNIPRKDKMHRGSADTLYNNIIIEFENDLRKTYKHAKEQLAGYLLGKFNSGDGYNFTLIASDFITWKIVAPAISCLENLENLNENELILNEIETASFTLTAENTEEFYYWIDRFLFKEEKQKATLKTVEEAFGQKSNVFIDSFRELHKVFNDAKKYGHVQVSYEQWHKFLSIAYGSFNADDSIFLIHSYLSIFAKMLAYAFVSNNDFIEDKEMRQILSGKIFTSYNIKNFVVNDFFQWVNDERNFYGLKKVFRLIAQEISAFDFSKIDEDILKGVYQELIDLDTRHSLGEYYTPDWLCERIVSEYDFKPKQKILDPSCGSGSFLRAAVAVIKKANPNLSALEINNQVYGIDIHPLSVQIAKTTMLLALGDNVTKIKKPIHLNIILANTLLAPEGVKDLFGSDFVIHIDKQKYLINTQVLDDVKMFDDVVDIADEVAEQTMNKEKLDIEVFSNILKNKIKTNGFTKQIVESYYKIYQGLKHVKEIGRDSIWKFILTNLYKPYFLAGKFDYIIGNPPWFTFSSVKNEEYQSVLEELAIEYNVKPTKTANFPHLEIAAIFQAYCSSYFLNNSGKMALVLPRAFFNADHHHNTRSGIAKGFEIKKIWDLERVTPLFRIPSCVFFSEKENGKKKITSSIASIEFEGKVPYHNCHYDLAEKHLSENKSELFLSQQGKSSAFSKQKSIKKQKPNPYKKHFKQGATIVPRAFYFVDLNQFVPDDYEGRIINLKTSKSIKTHAKPPWNKLDFTGQVESEFIFRTALSKSILPFALHEPDMITLPIIIEKNEEGKKKIKIYSADELLYKGWLKTARWFRNTENVWDIHRTEKNRKISLYNYLNWRNKITEQNLNAKYLVLYNASAKDANSTVVFRENFDVEFIVESKTYVYYTNNIKEAYYLIAVFNSKAPNLLMKDFQTRGLFGPRDIHKKILDIYFPRFNEKKKTHLKIADLGEICHEKANNYISKNPPKEELTPLKLGRLRLDIKKHLSEELTEIDKLVKKIMQ